MKIADNRYVSINYRLAPESGEEVDRSPAGSPLGFVAGTGSIIPGLESALMGREAGEDFRVTVEPEQAYGPVQRELLQIVPRERFPAGMEIVPGMAFQARGPRGPVAMTVAGVSDDAVTVDLNHPLAGKRLIFDVKVVEVRERARRRCRSSPAAAPAAGFLTRYPSFPDLPGFSVHDKEVR